MTHTPGPWKVLGGTVIIAGPSDKMIASTPEENAKLSFYETRANANLIAAAPDMLKGLRRAEQTIRNLASGFLEGDAKQIAENEAANLRDDIDKAEPES